ncbi:hypothetical protein ACIRPK_18745 [Kitasatospora sp. NPDC101801]|uniref:hypothetical protein n=1 Tax=Kitasatospora sp. NPDC101801 TaxID=3364103 RepID=UPI003822FC2B
MPSSIPAGHRRLAAAAGFVLAIGFALTGCGPGPTDTGVPARAVVSSPAAETTPAAPVVVPSPSATPTADATTPPPAPAATTPATKAPAPPATPKPAEPRRTTSAPSAPSAPTHAPTTAAAAGPCEIVSNAGNCYKAGQFCRDADLGRSTHDATGRLLTCRMVSGKPHWQV